MADDPWKLIIAVILLNQTAGKAAVPVLWQILERYPSPKALSEGQRVASLCLSDIPLTRAVVLLAPIPDLTELIACLGLQNVRASRLIQMSAMYCMDPPNLADCRPSRVPAVVQAPVSPPSEASDATTASPSTKTRSTVVRVKYPPTAISHLPGVGQYALDSYRIFSPDLPGGGAAKDEVACLICLRLTLPNQVRSAGPIKVTESVNPVPFISDSDAEWRQVMPFDKELRKYLVCTAHATDYPQAYISPDAASRSGAGPLTASSGTRCEVSWAPQLLNTCGNSRIHSIRSRRK